MSRHCITVVSFGPFERSVLERTAQTVGAGFRCLVTVREGHLDLGDFYDPARRQYNGNLLLKTMDDLFPLEGCKSIGLFNVDLFIPILTFIFGQAYLGGKSGIASMYRLSNERYGMTPDRELLTERFGKEVVHELGHMFGLIHCHHPDCVMRSSTYVEDIDQKSVIFCPACSVSLAQALRS